MKAPTRSTLDLRGPAQLSAGAGLCRQRQRVRHSGVNMAALAHRKDVEVVAAVWQYVGRLLPTVHAGASSVVGAPCSCSRGLVVDGAGAAVCRVWR